MRLRTLLALISLTLSGCYGGLQQYPTAKVSGKVLCEGQPVSDVRVYFQPISSKGRLESGKVGGGSAKTDGTFALSTYGTDDGAVVGKHNVIVDSPHPEDFPGFKCNCETHSNKSIQQVEVAANGENNFTITLPVRTAKSRPNINPKDLQDIKVADQAEAERNKAGN